MNNNIGDLILEHFQTKLLRNYTIILKMFNLRKKKNLHKNNIVRHFMIKKVEEIR